MSKLIPRRTIDALRHCVDVSVDIVGIECILYIPTQSSLATAEYLDVYMTPQDLQYIAYKTNVFIEWGASNYRLKKLGIYSEESTPFICWFGNKAKVIGTSQDGVEVDIDIPIHSYFEVNPEVIPGNIKVTNQFEIVNPIVKGLHDAVIRKGYAAVPRRVEIR